MATKARNCEETLVLLGLKTKHPCCKNCHRRHDLFVFKLEAGGKRPVYAVTCCHIAKLLFAAARRGERRVVARKTVEVQLDSYDIADALAS